MATKNGSGVVTMGGIRAWMPVIVTIVVLLLSIGVFQGTFTAYARQVDNNTGRLEVIERQHIETQVALARIQTDMAYLRQAVDKLLELHTQK
jgi:hypothetical protein